MGKLRNGSPGTAHRVFRASQLRPSLGDMREEMHYNHRTRVP